MTLAIPRQQLRLKLSQLPLHVLVIRSHRYRLIVQILHLSGLSRHHAIINITIDNEPSVPLLLHRQALLTDVDLMAYSELRLRARWLK